MSGGPKGAKRPLERPLDGGVRRHRSLLREATRDAKTAALDDPRGNGHPMSRTQAATTRHLFRTRQRQLGPGLVAAHRVADLVFFDGAAVWLEEHCRALAPATAADND